MSTLQIIALVVGIVIAANVLFVLALLLFGRRPKEAKPVTRQELLEIRDDWSWPR